MKKEVYYLTTVIAGLLLVTYFVLINKPNVPLESTNTTSNLLVSPIPTQEDMKKTKPLVTQKKQWDNPPAMSIDTSKTYTAILKTTKGDITIALDAKTTPITVNNFVFLAQQKFYDNVIFHRVIKGFMIQSGDPLGTGTGGPGYRFDDEPFTGEYTRGTVAMANSGPNTNGSQFFVMHGDAALTKNYVIFGRVKSGLDVVDAIANSEVTAGSSGENSTPVKPEKITSVTIVEE